MPDPVNNNKAVETEEELARLEKETNDALAQDQSEGEKQTPSSESASEKTETPTEGESESDTEGTEAQTDGGEKKTEDTDDEDLTDEEKRQLSEKAQKRFRALAAKKKELEERVRTLEQGNNSSTPQDKGEDEGKSHKLPWEEDSEDEETKTISPEQYEADVTAKAEAAAEKKVQEKFENREIVQNLQTDIATVESKYPELNPESLDDYDAHLVKEISDLYRVQFKQNKKLRFGPFVERIMSLRESGKAKGKSEVTAKVAKQAAEQALGPSQTPSKNSDPIAAIKNAKSIEELEALEKTLPQG